MVRGPGHSLSAVFLEGPPPLGRVVVPLVGGVSAFYGLNGVGKSRLLAAVKDVLSGRWPAGAKSASLYLCIDEAAGAQDGGFVYEAARVASATLSETSARLDQYVGSGPGLDPDLYKQWPFGSLVEELFGVSLEGGDGEEMPDQIRRDIQSDIGCGYVALHPARQGRPGWTMWSCAILGGDAENPYTGLPRGEGTVVSQAAVAVCGVMIVSYSMGVNRPSRCWRRRRW